MPQDNYDVIGIEGPFSRLGVQGQREQYYRITAETVPHGVRILAEVPSEQANAKALAPILKQKAAELESVFTL